MKIVTTVLVGIVILARTLIIFLKLDNNLDTSTQTVNNMIVVDGKQIVTINVKKKGGYSPRITEA